MSDPHLRIRLPFSLHAGRSSVPAFAAAGDDAFAAQQVEFIQHLFGHSTFLRDHARATPVSDAFLAVFVNLFDTLLENAPAEAGQCVTQLQQILDVIAPGSGSAAAPILRTGTGRHDGGTGQV